MDTTQLAAQIGKSPLAKAKRLEAERERSKREGEFIVLAHLGYQADIFLRLKRRLRANEVVNTYLDVIEREKLSLETEFALNGVLTAKLESLKKDVTQTPGNTPESALLQNKIQAFTAVVDALNQRHFPDSTERQFTDIPKLKLFWNEDKGVLIDLFKQLTSINNKDGKPLIPNTDKDIARFIIESFAGFEANQADNLAKELSRNTRPKKSERLVEIKVTG